jgi:hypothetical protein
MGEPSLFGFFSLPPDDQLMPGTGGWLPSVLANKKVEVEILLAQDGETVEQLRMRAGMSF